jgi:aminoglycoside phosphotransferase (APT) family kinase protein
MLLRTLYGLGLPVPEPLSLGVGDSALPSSLVLGYVEGEIRFDNGEVESYIEQIAKLLVAIHNVDLASVNLALLPRVEECAEVEGESPGSANQSLEENRVRDALVAYGAMTRGNRPALLHGDFWPGNVLWRDDKAVAVVDWEDAQIGDPLLDLAISRLDIASILGQDAMHLFTECYQSLMHLDDSDLPYWDLCAALRLIRLAGADLGAWAAFFSPYGRPDVTEQSIMWECQTFIRQALNKIETGTLATSQAGCTTA